jgi:hypothetical protein
MPLSSKLRAPLNRHARYRLEMWLGVTEMTSAATVNSKIDIVFFIELPVYFCLSSAFGSR